MIPGTTSQNEMSSSTAIAMLSRNVFQIPQIQNEQAVYCSPKFGMIAQDFDDVVIVNSG
jgi:hypothetical protein